MAADRVTFPTEKNCVAWKTYKRMFLVKSVAPVGISCKAVVETSSSSAGKKVVVKVPIASFDSGEPARDKDVEKTLGADRNPEVIITTLPVTPEQSSALFSTGRAQLEADLEVNGRTIRKAFAIELEPDRSSVYVKLGTTFTEMGIPAPTVAGGLVAKVRDTLELHGRLALPEALKNP